MRPFEVAAHEPDQPVELVGDLRQPGVDVIHALLVHPQALLRMDEIFSLELLNLGLPPLDIGHHDDRILESPDFLFEVHLYLV